MQSHCPSRPGSILHFHDSSIVPREKVQSHCLITSCLLLPRDSLQHLNKLPHSITHRNLPRRPLLPIPQHHIRTKLHQQARRILRPAHSSTVQRRAAIDHPRIRVRSRTQQQRQRLRPAVEHRPVRGRRLHESRRLQTRVVRQDERDERRGPVLDGVHERRGVVAVLDVDVGACGEQEAGHGDVVGVAGLVQR